MQSVYLEPVPPLRVLTVFGTRPEAIKLGPVIRELERQGSAVVSRVCVTAQHRAMLDQILRVSWKLMLPASLLLLLATAATIVWRTPHA